MIVSVFEQKFGKRDVGFLIRKFEERKDRSILIQTVKNTFKENGLKLVDTLEHRFHNELWPNIKEYLDNCAFGVIVIDNFSPQDNNRFNPNTFLEIGYLIALQKPILILLQNSLEKELPADVKPFIYQTFDSEDRDSPTLKNKISQWIKNHKSKPGYLTIYFKKDALSLDFMEEFKNLIYIMSDCEVVSNKSTSVEIEDLKELKINYGYGVMKVLFKICSIDTAHKFKDDFLNNRYVHVKRITDAVLKIEVSDFPDVIKPINQGVSYLLNNETEELVYCTRESITNCEREIDYAKKFFTRKETLREEEIEIVILKKFDESTGFLYVTNYKHAPNLYPLKMYHGRKKDRLPCIPLDTADILFMTLYGEIPTPNIIKTNLGFRDKYMKAVDLHIDKVIYTIQDGVPTEFGLAKNIKTFSR